MKLETKRLILRELTINDLEALKKVIGDKDNMKYYHEDFDEKKVIEWILRNIERYKTFGFGLWAVCLKESGELIGDCGLTLQNIHEVIRPEIGYHIRRDMQQKGIAKEAAIAVRDWTFSNTPFKEIYSYMKSHNHASRQAALSWGCQFVEEYVSQNELISVYKIKKEDIKRYL
ncbi:GNAT family N-acetyltransferase [Acholeplasma hippikon]|uniref:3-methyladenine DNA glycosylase n=1 Tax=Acholeplasma hippikon TaxID=264636 RepID=A0A449BI62_9MOLU|nr:GNAT family N-acetyltransferase [Acholeplasma hippikon]VEU82135.1 3-methyladenine DNA glycosylase [Acholeplasma hippikon]